MNNGKDKITALYVKPNDKPKVISICDELESLQEAVGGFIECFYPFNDDITIVLNEEGKILNLPSNRAIKDKDGNVVEIICGNFLILGSKPEDDHFSSLSPEQIERYMNMFMDPEMFFRDLSTDKIIAVKLR